MMTDDASRPDADRRIARRIRRAYVLALSIVATMTVAVFMVEERSLLRFEQSATILNVAGKQRMLSQRVAMFSHQFAYARNEGVARLAAGNLLKTTNEMADSYAWLLEKAPLLGSGGQMTPATEAVYFDEPHAVDRRLAAYMAKVNAMLESEGDARKARYNAIHFDAADILVSALDAAVLQLERDARADIASARNLRLVMMVAVLLTLIAEWLLIFRPLARTIEEKTRALEAAREEVSYAALHDPLTGLPNRRMLGEILTTTLAQAKRRRKPMTVCHIDLDLFKGINDTMGHATGDAVLKHAATVLENATRDSDFVARVGGDEFVVVDCMFGDPDGVMVMAQRILDRMARPFEAEGHTCRITTSIGIAEYDPEDDDLEAMMHRADIALYHAKELGRNQALIYTEDARKAFDQRVVQAAA